MKYGSQSSEKMTDKQMMANCRTVKELQPKMGMVDNS